MRTLEIWRATPEQTRALSAEYPVGDAFGGPAYGKREMPVVAIVGAVASFATGAAIAATATGIGSMIVAGAMMIGAAVTIVGTITGNQNLVKWGGILSIAGGIGAGVLGAMGGLSEAATAATGTSGYVDAIGNVAEGANAGSALSGAVAPATAAIPAAPPVEATGMLGPASELPSVTAPPATPAPQQPLTPGATETLAPQGGNAYATPVPEAASAYTPAAPAGTEGGFFDRAGRWINNNRELARAGLSGATGLLASAVPKPTTDLERAQMEESRLRAARMDPNSAWWRRKPVGG